MSDATPGLHPVIPRTRAAAVADELRRLIQAGELPPGTRLRQAEIAARLGVSTTPVREAFTALAREGLVQQDAQRGAIVFTPTPRDLEQNYEIRIALEPLATRIAATKLTDAELEGMAAMVDEMRSSFATVRYAELNRAFHSAIYQAADRERLGELIDNLRDEAARYMRMVDIYTDQAYWEAAQRQHEAILEALQARAPARAAKAMAQHLQHSAKYLAQSVFPRDASRGAD